MFKNFANFFRQLDARIKVTIAGMGIYNWGQQLSFQYTQLYAAVLGANAIQIGFLMSARYAISSLLSIPLGWFTENVGVKKVMLLGLISSSISLVLFSVAVNWLFLVPAFILAGIISLYPLADILFITVSNPHQRALIMSLSRVVWGILSVFAPFFAAVMISAFGGISVEGIRPLYCLQLLLGLFVLLFFFFKLTPLPRTSARKNLAFSALVRDFRDFFEGAPWIKRWILLRIIRTFSIGLALPFIPLWMVNVKHATPVILGGLGTLSVIATLLVQFPVGILADRLGRKTAYLLLRPITYLGTVILILAPHPEYLFFVGLLGTTGMGSETGGIGGASFIPFITMNWELVSEEKRGRWFGLEGLINLSVIPASLLGGFLWEQGFLLEVLLFPIVLELLLVIPLLATIPDTIHNK